MPNKPIGTIDALLDLPANNAWTNTLTLLCQGSTCPIIALDRADNARQAGLIDRYQSGCPCPRTDRWW